MSRRRSERITQIAEAGIRILATRGRHALTHRAVDAEAGLPTGSTSYYARTREALVSLVVDHIATLDAGADADSEARGSADRDAVAAVAEAPTDAPALAHFLAEWVYDQLTRTSARTLARYELTLEAAHNPTLRATLTSAGAQFRAAAVALLAAAGSTEPDRHGRFLVAACEGIIFDTLVGAGAARPPSRADVEADLRDLLTGLLTRAADR